MDGSTFFVVYNPLRAKDIFYIMADLEKVQMAKKEITDEYKSNENVEIYYYSPFDISVLSNEHGPFTFRFHVEELKEDSNFIRMTVTENNTQKDCDYEVSLTEYAELACPRGEMGFYEKYINNFKIKQL